MTHKIIVALDYDNQTDALALVEQLNPELCRLKVGKEMFTLFGPELVKTFQSKGFDIFLDLKFHDIPNTVAKAVKAAAELGVWMVNVHASGGKPMMEAAKRALEPYGDDAPFLIAVTVLTSMDENTLSEIGVVNTLETQVLNLATQTKQAGLDGVVCSAQEAEFLKRHLGKDFQLITPGIRLVNSQSDDQQRIMTPQKAIIAGSDHLVIGRPITRADDPLQVLTAIFDSIN